VGKTCAWFTYDSSGQVLTRRDKPVALNGEQFMVGSNDDPNQAFGTDSWGQALSDSEFALNSTNINGSATVHSYLYADGHPVADVSNTYSNTLKELSLLNGTAVYGPSPGFDADGNPIPAPLLGYTLALQASDIVMNATTGIVDRQATARNIATRAYGSAFTNLSTGAQVLPST
jgi:hypothetical protein